MFQASAALCLSEKHVFEARNVNFICSQGGNLTLITSFDIKFSCFNSTLTRHHSFFRNQTHNPMYSSKWNRYVFSEGDLSTNWTQMQTHTTRLSSSPIQANHKALLLALGPWLVGIFHRLRLDAENQSELSAFRWQILKLGHSKSVSNLVCLLRKACEVQVMDPSIPFDGLQDAVEKFQGRQSRKMVKLDKNRFSSPTASQRAGQRRNSKDTRGNSVLLALRVLRISQEVACS